ncbi:DNA-binding protein YbaB [Tamaricihabitans halophyticus]|uniref:DNA-binding protein YbaB n=1 Tax=Tamaricihabitans halophyticus TaxID=1262583 RepID=A0A4R2QAM5_9PSEU|nr:YbaB/EbfC family nucleoid-associated protein [Tamaricihabitans halophyticus]TCP43865.1 DNA-binding protein YbaB [Tamaricihabitans halophyticus]
MSDAGGESSQDRSARLLARSQELQNKTARRRQAMEWAEKQSATVTGTAASADGMVTVTVDNTGMVTGLELAPDALRRGTSDQLARVITTVAQQATASARNQIKETYEGLVNEGLLGSAPPGLLAAPEVSADGAALPPAPARRAAAPAAAEPPPAAAPGVFDTPVPTARTAPAPEAPKPTRAEPPDQFLEDAPSSPPVIPREHTTLPADITADITAEPATPAAGPPVAEPPRARPRRARAEEEMPESWLQDAPKWADENRRR